MVLTSADVEVCNLMPAGTEPPQPQAGGALYVTADHKRWYLKIDGLDGSPEGRAYQLWFITEGGGPVSAGTFHAKPGVRLERISDEVPAGMIAVKVTLEPVGGSPEPTGPPVLYGDEVMRIL